MRTATGHLCHCVGCSEEPPGLCLGELNRNPYVPPESLHVPTPTNKRGKPIVDRGSDPGLRIAKVIVACCAVWIAFWTIAGVWVWLFNIWK